MESLNENEQTFLLKNLDLDLQSRPIQFTRQCRITKRSNAIILNTTMGMFIYLMLRTSNISQLYRKIIILIHSVS